MSSLRSSQGFSNVGLESLRFKGVTGAGILGVNPQGVASVTSAPTLESLTVTGDVVLAGAVGMGNLTTTNLVSSQANIAQGTFTNLTVTDTALITNLIKINTTDTLAIEQLLVGATTYSNIGDYDLKVLDGGMRIAGSGPLDMDSGTATIPYIRTTSIAGIGGNPIQCNGASFEDVAAIQATGDITSQGNLTVDQTVSVNSIKINESSSNNITGVNALGVDTLTYQTITTTDTASAISVGKLELVAPNTSITVDLQAADNALVVQAGVGQNLQIIPDVNNISQNQLLTTGDVFITAPNKEIVIGPIGEGAAGLRVASDGAVKVGGDFVVGTTAGTTNYVTMQASTQSVGIGTTNPTATLDVDGTGHFGGGVTFDSGIIGAGGLQITAVGGGITLVADPGPQFPVDIALRAKNQAFTLTTTAGTTVASLLAAPYVGSNGYSYLTQEGDAVISWDAGADHSIAPSSYGLVIAPHNGIGGIRMDPNGNVGVGKAIPTAMLDVDGTGHFSGGVTFDSGVTFNNGINVNGVAKLTASPDNYLLFGSDFADIRFFNSGLTTEPAGRIVGEQNSLFFQSATVSQFTQLGSSEDSALYINHLTNQVGVNTNNLSTYALSVIGTGYFDGAVGISVAVPQTTLDVAGSMNLVGTEFLLGGSTTQYYPVSFDTTPSWYTGEYMLNIAHSDSHRDQIGTTWTGTVNMIVRGHNNNWGNLSDYYNLQFSQDPIGNGLLLGNFQPDRTSEAVVVWLKGGLHYYWSGIGVVPIDLNPTGISVTMPNGQNTVYGPGITQFPTTYTEGSTMYAGTTIVPNPIFSQQYGTVEYTTENNIVKNYSADLIITGPAGATMAQFSTGGVNFGTSTLTAGAGNFSGQLNANNGLSATTGNFSGQLNANNGLSATTGNFSGQLNANSGLSATTGNFNSNVNITGNLTIGANSYLQVTSIAQLNPTVYYSDAQPDWDSDDTPMPSDNAFVCSNPSVGVFANHSMLICNIQMNLGANDTGNDSILQPVITCNTSTLLGSALTSPKGSNSFKVLTSTIILLRGIHYSLGQTPAPTIKLYFNWMGGRIMLNAGDSLNTITIYGIL